MTTPPKDETAAWGDHPQLRSLRLLISVLTATLIIGIFTIFAVLIWRISAEAPPAKAPLTAINVDQIEIPAGAAITATGVTDDAITLAITDETGEALLVFSPETGALIKRIEVSRTP